MAVLNHSETLPTSPTKESSKERWGGLWQWSLVVKWKENEKFEGRKECQVTDFDTKGGEPGMALMGKKMGVAWRINW